VLDSGSGVPEEDMGRLCEPYSARLQRNRRLHGWSGAGLSVCKRLIKAQEGQMWAERHSPRGMEFGLRLRAIQAE